MAQLRIEDCYRGTIAPLSRAEERELIRRYQEEGDMEAREQVVKANLRFVITVAQQFRGYLPIEDAIGEGSLGLLKALDRYDASRGCKFITYAVWWIRQAIHEALRNEGHILAKPQLLASVNERFRKAARAAGIPGMVPKDLRSTTETKQYELGWPDELVSKWQGHTSEVSYRHYVSIRGELGAKAANDLDDAVFDEEYVQSMDKTKASGAS